MFLSGDHASPINAAMPQGETMLNLSASSLASVNRDHPTPLEVAASAAAAAAALARQSPGDAAAQRGLAMAKAEMLALLVSP